MKNKRTINGAKATVAHEYQKALTGSTSGETAAGGAGFFRSGMAASWRLAGFLTGAEP